jgi:hypothetical protein
MSKLLETLLIGPRGGGGGVERPCELGRASVASGFRDGSTQPPLIRHVTGTVRKRV